MLKLEITNPKMLWETCYFYWEFYPYLLAVGLDTGLIGTVFTGVIKVGFRNSKAMKVQLAPPVLKK